MANSILASMLWTSAVLVAMTNAAEFLGSQRQYMQMDIVEEVLLSQLSARANRAEINLIEEELRPLYAVLPKNARGQLEPSVVRYAVHRYFTNKHGWHVKGLGHSGGNNTLTTSANILKEQAPFYIQRAFETRMENEGMGLHEVAVFASTLGDLIRRDIVGVLDHTYDALSISKFDLQSDNDFDHLALVYLALHIRGVDGAQEFTKDAVHEALTDSDAYFLDWKDSAMWSIDLRHTLDLKLDARRNPFIGGVAYTHAVEYVEELAHQFKSTQNRHCSSLKDMLVDMEEHGSGRVPLAKFYSGFKDSTWPFWEKVEYLRALGALDESDSRMPRVIIPNYIGGHNNCLEPSGFYSVCCLDECMSLLTHVENIIAAPTATPARIVEIISALSSDTVVAPRNLSTTVLARLNEIANHHNGNIPLHGRLFAQWMHHAYPRECPFPHVSGTTQQIAPTEWDKQFGADSTEASDEDMLVWVQGDYVAPPSESLPWTEVEELVTSQQRLFEANDQSGVSTTLRALGIFAAVSFALKPMLTKGASASSVGSAGFCGGKKEMHLV